MIQKFYERGYLLVIVDDVQLTDAPEVLVQELHVVVDDLQR